MRYITHIMNCDFDTLLGLLLEEVEELLVHGFILCAASENVAEGFIDDIVGFDVLSPTLGDTCCCAPEDAAFMLADLLVEAFKDVERPMAYKEGLQPRSIPLAYGPRYHISRLPKAGAGRGA